MYLRGVLASPTAQAELRSFLDCGAIFRRHGFRPQVELLLVQWENLIEMRRQHASSRARTFVRQARTIAAAAQRAGFADAIIPVAVEVDIACAPFVIRHGYYNRTVTFLPCRCHPQRGTTP